MSLRDNLSGHLDKIRKQYGLSVTAFSEKLGIARSSMQALLMGQGNPRTDTIECIAGKLGIDPLQLLSPLSYPSDIRLDPRNRKEQEEKT